MKLQIQANALRIQISDANVARLRWDGCVKGWMDVGPGRRFTYALETGDESDRISAELEDDSLTVLMPRSWIERWASGDEATMESMQPIDGDQHLHLLIEKDALPADGQTSPPAPSAPR